jgi:hypothetical protein
MSVDISEQLVELMPRYRLFARGLGDEIKWLRAEVQRLRAEVQLLRAEVRRLGGGEDVTLPLPEERTMCKKPFRRSGF